MTFLGDVFGWSSVSGKRMNLALQDVLLGKLDTEIEILNYFITLVKLHILIKVENVV